MDSHLESYRIFREVVRAQSFSGAAKALYVSQPAVSQSVAALEDALGLCLFVRSSRGASLTEEGRLLYDYVEQALGLLEAGERKLAQHRRLESGEVRIAAADASSRHYLLPYLGRFNAQHPGIRLHVVNRTSDQSVALLKSGTVDLALVNLPYEDESLTFIPCLKVQDVFVVGSKYRQLAQEALSPFALVRHPLIMLEKLSNSRRFVDRYFSALGLTLQPEIELGSHDLLLEFAAIDLGVACVVREFSLNAIAAGSVFPLSLCPALPSRAIAVCMLKNVPLSFAASAFLDVLNIQ